MNNGLHERITTSLDDISMQQELLHARLRTIAYRDNTLRIVEQDEHMVCTQDGNKDWTEVSLYTSDTPPFAELFHIKTFNHSILMTSGEKTTSHSFSF